MKEIEKIYINDNNNNNIKNRKRNDNDNNNNTPNIKDMVMIMKGINNNKKDEIGEFIANYNKSPDSTIKDEDDDDIKMDDDIDDK